MAIESSTTSSISPWRYKTQGSVWSSKWTVVWKSGGSPFPGTYKQCAKCASKSRLWLQTRVLLHLFPRGGTNTGKRVVLQVDGSVEVCRVTISRYLNAPVRVGYGYRVGYYFIYFPVVVQNTGKRVVLQVHGSVEVCRVTISRYL